MIIQDIIRLMEKMEYQTVRLNVPEVHLYCKRVQERILYVLLVDTQNMGNPNEVSIKGLILQLKQKLQERDENCQFLSIILTDQISEYRELAQIDSFVWFIDCRKQLLMIYENQREGFPELRENIEEILDQYRRQSNVNTLDVDRSKYNMPERSYSRKEALRNSLKHSPICCISIIALNVLIFLIMDLLFSEQKYNEVITQLGVQWVAVRYLKEYYRIFTYMFIHAGINHLFNNMLVLFFIGQSLERAIRKPRFLTIYFGSGIIAGIVSMGYNMIRNQYSLSVGASGAIFGLMGAVLYMVLINRGRLRTISTRQIVLCVFFSLYGGFTSSNTDNAAHIGGFLAGVVLAAILIRKENQKEREY